MPLTSEQIQDMQKKLKLLYDLTETSSPMYYSDGGSLRSASQTALENIEKISKSLKDSKTISAEDEKNLSRDMNDVFEAIDYSATKYIKFRPEKLNADKQNIGSIESSYDLKDSKLVNELKADVSGLQPSVEKSIVEPLSYSQAIKNITFGTEVEPLSKTTSNIITINYSYDNMGKHVDIFRRQDEYDASTNVLKSLGIVTAGGNMSASDTYTISYNNKLSPEQQTEIKNAISQFTDKQISELYKEGVFAAQQHSAGYIAEGGYVATMTNDAKGSYITSAVELAQIDLQGGGREDGRKISQKELNQLFQKAKEHGVLLSANNIKGENDSIESTYVDSDGKTIKIKQPVTFSDEAIKLDDQVAVLKK